MVEKTIEIVKMAKVNSILAHSGPNAGRDLFCINYKVTLSHGGDQSTTYHQGHFFARDELEAYQRWERYRGEKYEGDQ